MYEWRVAAVRGNVQRRMSTPLSGLCVLVVEDHSDSRDMLEESLSFMGAKVITVATAEAAVGRLAEADMVVTDYAMPGHSGVWLLEQVLAVPRAIPTILLSGFSAIQVPAVAEAPFTLKLLKPIDPLELGWQIVLVMGRARK